MKRIVGWLIILGIIILILILFISFNFGKSHETQSKKNIRTKSSIPVDAFIAQPSLLVNSIMVTGSLVAYDEVELKSETSGRIVYLNLDEGKHVKEGTLLVELFNEDLHAQMKKLHAQHQMQQQIVNRQGELLKVNGISQDAYDQSVFQLNALTAEIEVQKSSIRKTQVLAPFSGVIGLRQVSLGAIVNSSTVFATIRSEDNLKLDFQVPEKYGSLIKPNMNVQFTMYNRGIEYHALVIATEREIDANNRNLKVRAQVTSKAEELIPGAFANVTLTLYTDPKALLIPTQAIIPKEKSKNVIVAKNGKAHFVTIETGVRKESFIEVIEGIQPGDTVIRTGILFLKEGDQLTYQSITSTQL